MKQEVNQGLPNSSSAMISERHKNPALTMGAGNAHRENFTVPAILAIIAFILFVTLLIMQYVDFKALSVA